MVVDYVRVEFSGLVNLTLLSVAAPIVFLMDFEIINIPFYSFEVNLGVLMKDEAKKEELLDILRYYHSYVPTDESGKVDHKLCFGEDFYGLA